MVVALFSLTKKEPHKPGSPNLTITDGHIMLEVQLYPVKNERNSERSVLCVNQEWV